MASKQKLWLLHVWHDVEPHLHGPFETEEARLEAARKIRKSGGDLPDGLYKIDCASEPEVDVFSGGELDDDSLSKDGDDA